MAKALSPLISAAKRPRRWYTVFALSLAAFVDSGENESVGVEVALIRFEVRLYLPVTHK